MSDPASHANERLVLTPPFVSAADRFTHAHHVDFVERLSLAMPPEDEFSSNPDGSEESEILAFVDWAAGVHATVYEARKSLDWDDETYSTLRFTVDASGALVRLPDEVTA